MSAREIRRFNDRDVAVAREIGMAVNQLDRAAFDTRYRAAGLAADFELRASITRIGVRLPFVKYSLRRRLLLAPSPTRRALVVADIASGPFADIVDTYKATLLLDAASGDRGLPPLVNSERWATTAIVLGASVLAPANEPERWATTFGRAIGASRLRSDFGVTASFVESAPDWPSRRE
jgi:hypothetical protein